MKAVSRYMTLNRTLKAFIIGLSVGAALISACAVPAIVQNRLEAAAKAIRQENLTPARGDAFEFFSMADVSLTVLLDGKPRDGISVAADQDFFSVPPDGRVSLSLAPNRYLFTTGFENRKLNLYGEVFLGQTNEFVLDVDKAPSAPELQVWDVPKGDAKTIPLEIKGAELVTASNLPDGVSISKWDGEFVLNVDADRLFGGFWCFRLTAENRFGQAAFYACLRIPRSGIAVPVYTAQELFDIRRDLSGHYILMNDIDMSGIDDWIPIGTEIYPFTGIFDGGNHEIKNFHAPEQIIEGSEFALFGYVQNAQLRNTVFRAPVITPEIPSRELGTGFGGSVLSVKAVESLIENCASFEGIVSPSDGMAGGLLGYTQNSVILKCFNSTDVLCNMANRYLPNTGGIIGAAGGYISRCANEGEVKGNHLTGGIAGWGALANITRCINSGYIWGSTLVGAVPAGGIIQSNDNGTVGYSYFVRGLAPIGAHCGGGVVTSVIPVLIDDLRASEKLPLLGSFDGEAPEWAYASLDAKGPVPFGIFKERTSAPTISQAGRSVEVLPVDGVRYFYTLDGGDPYIECTEPVEQLSIKLKQDQKLRVFATVRGFYDSELITVTGGR